MSKLLELKGTWPVLGFVGRMCPGGLRAAAPTVPEQVGQLRWTAKEPPQRHTVPSFTHAASHRQLKSSGGGGGRDTKWTPSTLEGRVGCRYCAVTQSIAGQLLSPASSEISLHVNGLDGALVTGHTNVSLAKSEEKSYR